MKKPALVDANVVLRYLLSHDAQQSPEAEALFTKAPAGSLLLTSIILAEVGWVLLSHYKVPRDQVALALQRVIAQPSVQVDAVIIDAVTRFAVTKLDLADCVLAAQARHGQCDVITFDKDFQRFQDITAIGAKAALSRLQSR
jgi:predicted nucleic-acid-binding protein